MKGKTPQVGDRVLVEAVYNPNMPFKWNAQRIQTLPQLANQTVGQESFGLPTSTTTVQHQSVFVELYIKKCLFINVHSSSWLYWLILKYPFHSIAHDPNLSVLLVFIDPNCLIVPLLPTVMFLIPPQLQQPPQALPQASPQLGSLYNEPGMQLRYSDMHSAADNRQNVT